MNRRNFFQTVLATIVGIVGSKTAKTEDEQDIEDSLESLKEPGSMSLEMFTSGTYSTGSCNYNWICNYCKGECFTKGKICQDGST